MGLESEDSAAVCLRCGECKAVDDADLAFLVLDGGKARAAFRDLELNVREIQAAAFPNKDNYDQLAQGDAVHMTEYKNGKASFSWGILEDPWIYVEDFGQYMMLAKCPVSAGLSGCGLYDGGDRLLGIICGMNTSGQAVAVPLHMVMARWEDEIGRRQNIY